MFRTAQPFYSFTQAVLLGATQINTNKETWPTIFLVKHSNFWQLAHSEVSSELHRSGPVFMCFPLSDWFIHFHPLNTFALMWQNDILLTQQGRLLWQETYWNGSSKESGSFHSPAFHNIDGSVHTYVGACLKHVILHNIVDIGWAHNMFMHMHTILLKKV